MICQGVSGSGATDKVLASLLSSFQVPEKVWCIVFAVAFWHMKIRAVFTPLALVSCGVGAAVLEVIDYRLPEIAIIFVCVPSL
jgi:hypothetical protein